MQGLLIPFITILVEAVKLTGKIDKAYMPLVAIVIGAVFGFANTQTFAGVVEGVVAGGAAVGLYEVVKGSKRMF